MIIYLIGLLWLFSPLLVKGIFPFYGSSTGAIEWEAYEPRFVRKSDLSYYKLEAFHKLVKVPAYHEGGPIPPTGDEIHLYVRKFQSAVPPKRVVWFLSGGPGQRGDVLEQSLSYLTFMVGPETVILIPDHRGVGRSTRIMSEIEAEARDEFDFNALSMQTKTPINCMTTYNAGADIAFLSKKISIEFPGIKQYIKGTSYGTAWGMTAINIDQKLYGGSLFNGILLEGVIYRNGMANRTYGTGIEILENCATNKTCIELAGGNPLRLVHAIRAFEEDPNRNDCRKIFKGFIASLPDQRPQAHRSFLGAIVGLDVKSQDIKKRVAPQMLLVPLLLHLEHCPNPEKFRALLDLTWATLRQGSIQPTGIATNRRMANRMQLFVNATEDQVRSSSSVNSFINSYIGNTQMQYEELPCYCRPQGPCPARLNQQCMRGMGDYAKEYFGRTYVSAAPESLSPVKAPKITLIMVQGTLDPRTTSMGARATFAESVAAVKHYYEIRNGGHNVFGLDDCMKNLYLELFGEGNHHMTQACIDKLNELPLDWEGTNAPEYSVRGLFPDTPTPPNMQVPPFDPNEDCWRPPSFNLMQHPPWAVSYQPGASSAFLGGLLGTSTPQPSSGSGLGTSWFQKVLGGGQVNTPSVSPPAPAPPLKPSQTPSPPLESSRSSATPSTPSPPSASSPPSATSSTPPPSAASPRSSAPSSTPPPPSAASRSSAPSSTPSSASSQPSAPSPPSAPSSTPSRSSAPSSTPSPSPSSTSPPVPSASQKVTEKDCSEGTNGFFSSLANYGPSGATEWMSENSGNIILAFVMVGLGALLHYYGPTIWRWTKQLTGYAASGGGESLADKEIAYKILLGNPFATEKTSKDSIKMIQVRRGGAELSGVQFNPLRELDSVENAARAIYTASSYYENLQRAIDMHYYPLIFAMIKRIAKVSEPQPIGELEKCLRLLVKDSLPPYMATNFIRNTDLKNKETTFDLVMQMAKDFKPKFYLSYYHGLLESEIFSAETIKNNTIVKGTEDPIIRMLLFLIGDPLNLDPKQVRQSIGSFSEEALENFEMLIQKYRCLTSLERQDRCEKIQQILKGAFEKTAVSSAANNLIKARYFRILSMMYPQIFTTPFNLQAILANPSKNLPQTDAQDLAMLLLLYKPNKIDISNALKKLPTSIPPGVKLVLENYAEPDMAQDPCSGASLGKPITTGFEKILGGGREDAAIGILSMKMHWHPDNFQISKPIFHKSAMEVLDLYIKAYCEFKKEADQSKRPTLPAPKLTSKSTPPKPVEATQKTAPQKPRTSKITQKAPPRPAKTMGKPAPKTTSKSRSALTNKR